MPKLQLYSRNLRGQNVLQDRPQICGEEKISETFFSKDDTKNGFGLERFNIGR